jgi:hypothetical protein
MYQDRACKFEADTKHSEGDRDISNICGGFNDDTL